MTTLYEACVTSVSQARHAEQAGADRLELCARIATGGLTPPARRISAVRAATSLPLHVMIRHDRGDFYCDAMALHRMHTEIAAARHAGADGVVCGVLGRDRSLDVPAMRGLMAAARGLTVTVHRAFDRVPDQLAVLEELVLLGVDRILTSGGAPTAPPGADRLRTLVHAARGRIGIIAGGGVRAENVRSMLAATGVPEVHAHLTRLREMRALASAVGREEREVRSEK
ncbi:MAG: copper homeostasis protein CutC [Gemmatimonadales bacterium]